jgi:hypothetical protein
MHTPFPPRSNRPRDVLLGEIRLCFATAGGCLLIGGAALAFGHWRGDHVSLVALLPVAGFYGLMAFERLFKVWRLDARTPASDVPASQSSNGSSPAPERVAR